MKNKIKTLYILIVFVSTILTVGCSKDEQENFDTNTELINPMEYIGVEHNLFMKDFTNNLEKSYKNKKWSKASFLSDKYVTQFSSVMNESYHNRYKLSTSTVEYQKNVYNQLNLNEWFDNDNTTSLDLAKSVMSRGTHLKSAKTKSKNAASNKDQEFTNNLLQDIYEVSSKGYDSEKEAYIALEEVVKKHEKLILSQEWTPEEKYALGALAVSKHSVQFWKNYDFSVFENSALSKSYSKKETNPRSSIIVGADVAGYVVGGVVGGTGGSFLGPAGTVGGFLGGKAAGAWAGSAAAATAIAIYDAWSDWFN